jgi:signal transduction histidine kinase
MNNIEPIIFLIPVIASILVIIFYYILLKKTTNKAVFNHFIFTVIILSFFLNFAWELIQSPLYKGHSYNTAHIALCALASLADAIMILLLYFSLALIYKNPFWVRNLKLDRIITLILIGGIGAILVEIRHLLVGNWAYAPSMPIIPFVNAGLSPVLQFMILPVIVYSLSFYFLKHNII